MAILYFMPNRLLSGFVFPFAGMPTLAHWLAGVLPLTHFNRLIRGIVFKGNGWVELRPNIWPILAFTVIVMAVAVRSYRRTLD